MKRFVGRTSVPLGGCVYLSALSDAVVLRRPGETEMCCAHSFQKVGRYHLYMNTQNSFLPLKLSPSGWFSPVSSICWHQCAAVVKGTEVLLCSLQGRWECCALICSLTHTHHLVLWHCWRMTLKTEIQLILGPSGLCSVRGIQLLLMSGRFCWVGKKEDNSH